MVNLAAGGLFSKPHRNSTASAPTTADGQQPPEENRLDRADN
jgi:hypothetical protein